MFITTGTLKLKRPSFGTLARIGAGGLIITSVGLFYQYVFQYRLRNTKTYRKVKEILYNHEETINQLGKPIKEGYIKFHEDINNLKHFSVPLRGSKTNGILNCEYLLSEAEVQPEISKLEIIFPDTSNKSFILYKN